MKQIFRSIKNSEMQNEIESLKALLVVKDLKSSDLQCQLLSLNRKNEQEKRLIDFHINELNKKIEFYQNEISQKNILVADLRKCVQELFDNTTSCFFFLTKN